jgi:hypothetical protein
MAIERPRPRAKSHAARIALAQRLLNQLEQLPPKLDDVGLAIELQLLKRDLARGHATLRAAPVENAYLSVVTLVEATMACLTWKEYTPVILDAFRTAFTAGTHPGPFRSPDYDALRRLFRSHAIPTSPR